MDLVYWHQVVVDFAIVHQFLSSIDGHAVDTCRWFTCKL